ncbi:hypothetical protein Salat_1813000 [Sesamum alatum]|uniref:Transmembrane protein n=1 Tax=Sesamum alatum TaxID=300844 RepID=A0AAE1Y2Z7_9LAMI|nr:hypothetical protein Salat_1813000 [Sesamum alatum]
MSALEEGRNLVESHGGGEANKERREHLRHLQKEAFQLANYYFVFQGVIFTAFYSTPSTLKCHYRWVPFALSSLAGTLNLCALSNIAFKYKTTLDDIDRNAVMVARGNPAQPRSEPIVVRWERMWRLLYVLGCMGLFIGFFVITLIGSWKITCGEGGSAASPPPPPATT